MKLRSIIFLILAFNALIASAQQKTRILFLLDASGSMYAKMQSETRITTAKKLLLNMVDSLSRVPNVELGLRVFGHRSPTKAQDCRDTRLEVGFSPKNHGAMKETIDAIVPKGTTPIAYSLQEAAYDFPKEDGVRNVIILITDGIEECTGDPCAISEALQRQGVILKPFIIGMAPGEDFAKFFECVGRYFDASNESEFGRILGVVVSQAIQSTTAQVNLLDVFGRATESNVNMTFYDAKSGKIIYNYIHTMNDRGFPDTLTLDPSFVYEIQVHTLPPVFAQNIKIEPGRHNIIPIDAPQGSLNLKIEGVTAYPDLKAVVRKSGQLQTLNAQIFNQTQLYLVGKYDLEILTVPRIYLNKISVDQSKITEIKIPQPGKLNLTGNSEYFGAIYYYRNRKLEWVCDIDPKQKKQLITLQPGQYKLIYRARQATKTFLTLEKPFEITSGGSTHIHLN